MMPVTRASAYAYLKMSEHVYRGESGLFKDDSVPKASEWVVKEKRSGTSGFFAVVYENVTQKQRVVSFRGTDSAGAVWEDVAGVVFNGNSPQKEAAFKVVDDVVKKAKEEGYEVSFTGHSLGAFLASLSVFHCHRYLDYPQAFAVTFENPGPREAMEKLRPNIPGPFDLSVLDITTYQSYPNRINTFGQQVGSIYTIDGNLGGWGSLPGLFLKRAHGTAGMVEYFEANQNNPKLVLLTDWPLGNQRDVFFKESDFKEGRYQFKTKDEDALDESIGKKPQGELKVSLQQQTYNLEVLGHFQQSLKYDNQSSLALRHFLFTAQAFLKTFYNGLIDISKHPERLEALKNNWKELNIDKDVAQYLLSYTIQQDTFHVPMVCLQEGMDVSVFQNKLETWLADEKNAKSAAELLTLSIADNDKRTKLTGMLLESGAQTGNIKIGTLETIAAEIPEYLINQDNPMEDIHQLLDKVKETFKEVVGLRIEKGAKTGDIQIDNLKTSGIKLSTHQYSPADGSGSKAHDKGKGKQEGVGNNNPVKKF